MGLKPGGLDKLMERAVSSMARRNLITPHFELALLKADWPPEYSIKVYNKERHFDGLFHPSSHCDLGVLELFYRFHPRYRDTMLFERPSPQLEMTFQVGNCYHALLQSLFIHLGFTTSEYVEVTFTDQRRHSSGTLDVQRFFLPDGSWVPVELKSAGFLPKQPIRKHYLQLQVYMDLGCGPEPAERGVLFYLEKAGSHRSMEFVVHRDEEALAEVYGRWATVLEAIEFDDAAGLRECCNANSSTHLTCPAREVCRIGPPRPSGV